MEINMTISYVLCVFSSTKGEDKKSKSYSHPWQVCMIYFVQILYNKKMRMQIKYNVYFKNPKFVKEVTHSNQLVEKQLS